MLAIAVVGFVVFWYGFRAAFRTDHPLMAVATGSMHPTLKVGDLIMVQGGLEAPYDEIDVGYANGTIIVFRGEVIGRRGDLIVHRAIDKFPRDGVWWFKTHGDANPPSSVEEFSEDFFVGKVVGWVPLLGWPNLFFQTTEGKLLIIILLAVLIIIEFIPFSKKEKVKGNRVARMYACVISCKHSARSNEF